MPSTASAMPSASDRAEADRSPPSSKAPAKRKEQGD